MVTALQSLHLNRFAHRVYYRHFHGFRPAQKEVTRALERSMQTAMEAGIAERGDYLEFGVFKGGAFWQAQQAADKLGLRHMRFIGFDSFQGLPAISDADRTANDEFYEGQYRCSKETVVRNLDRAGVDWNRTSLVKGFFDESLNDDVKKEHGLQAVAVALIDCDLYTSTVQVLSFIENLLLDGSVLIFDDWNCFHGDDHRGQRRALHEFLARRSDLSVESILSYGAYGQVFQLHRRSST